MTTITFFFKKLLNRNYSVWEDGVCNNTAARRHRIKGNVQMKLCKKGDQKEVDGIGHLKDKWHDFDSSWWNQFKSI
jgi:hypothetical protein